MPLAMYLHPQPKYKKGNKVRTGYGKGKIIKVEHYTTKYGGGFAYLIRYNLFTKLWCFEETILEVL